MSRPSEAQFIGCLIGQCLGDALGFVVEGYPAAECRGYVEDYLRAGRAGALGRVRLASGKELRGKGRQPVPATTHLPFATLPKNMGSTFRR